MNVHDVTYAEWIAKLEHKSLTFLETQRSPVVKGHNGTAYDEAVVHLIHKKRDEAMDEEDLPPLKRPRVSCVRHASEEDDDDEYVTRHVKNGPKGETVRVRVPRALDSGDD